MDNDDKAMNAENVLNMHPRNLRLADVTQSNAFQEKHILDAMEEYARLYHSEQLKQIAGSIDISEIKKRINTIANSRKEGAVYTASGMSDMLNELAPKIAQLQAERDVLIETIRKDTEQIGKLQDEILELRFQGNMDEPTNT